MNSKKAPKHLQPKTRRWFNSIVKEYDLESHHIRLLTLASEAWDRCVQAREAIAKAKSLTYKDRFGSPKAKPEVAIERDSRTAFVRILRELGLDITEPDDEPRPPSLPGTAGRK